VDGSIEIQNVLVNISKTGLAELANVETRLEKINTTFICPPRNGDEDGRPLPDISSLSTHRLQGLVSAQDAFDLASRRADDDGKGKPIIKVVIQTDSSMS
jgi:hypothetical protein